MCLANFVYHGARKYTCTIATPGQCQALNLTLSCRQIGSHVCRIWTAL